MNPLDLVALIFLPVMIIMAAAGIVFLGSLPGKIARRRHHPWPDAVNAASWIGLATGVLWPFAFVWAFLPMPQGSGQPFVEESGSAESEDTGALQEKIDVLEAELAALKADESKAPKKKEETA